LTEPVQHRRSVALLTPVPGMVKGRRRRRSPGCERPLESVTGLPARGVL